MSDPPRWLIGQRIAWLGSGSGLPRTATARWIGRLPGMGAGWTLGIELDEALPLGGVDGKWAGQRLFSCKPLHGLFVPLASVIPESDIRTRVKQGFGEKLWLKELEEEFKQIHYDAPKRRREKKEQKVLKNEARKELKENNTEKGKDPSTLVPVSKEEVVKPQKSRNTVLPSNDEEEQEANAAYQWYDAIDHTAGEIQGPVVEHLYEEDSSHPMRDGQPRGNAVEAEIPCLPVSSDQPSKGYSKDSEDNKDEEDRLAAQLTLPKGLAKFKASLLPEDGGSLTDQEAKGKLNPDTLAVARLLRRLEAAIAGGQHESAAVLARQLARLKINCSVTRHANNRRNLVNNSQDSAADCGASSVGSSSSSSTKMTIDMYVEDKVSHLGPIPVVVSLSMTVGELKARVEQDFEIPVGVQRWIIGRRLASNDELTLLQHDVTSNGTPVFLYLVAPADIEASASGNASSKESRSSKASEKGEESDHLEVNEIKEEPSPAPTAPEERIIARPLDDMPRGRGWYYNFEEDRYSYCSDSDSDPEEVEQTIQPIQIEQNPVRREAPAETSGHPIYTPQDGVRLITADEESEEEEEEEEEEEVEEYEEEEELEELEEEAEEEVEEEEVEEEEEDDEIEGAAGENQGAADVKKQVSNIANQPENSMAENTGTLQLGWKCPLCTLVNPPTRPGCAACASERPPKYHPPSEYKAGKVEAERLEKERQEMDPEEAKRKEEDERRRDYERLLRLERSELVPNAEDFTCPVCFMDVVTTEGVTLRDCLHSFCRPCLVNTIQFSEDAEVKCPYRDDEYACDSTLQDREIRALVPPEVYEQLLARSMALAEKRMGAQAFHCKTPDCKGWCVLEDNINVFPCPVCRRTNCLTCQAIHDGVNCKQYQEGINKDSETNVDAKRTRDMLEEMVTRGEAIVCPTCAVVLMKKWGCDWLRCSMCKTEICWVTRGPRWGPGGKGDITGGCKCGVNGIKCHPKCNYCH